MAKKAEPQIKEDPSDFVEEKGSALVEAKASDTAMSLGGLQLVVDDHNIKSVFQARKQMQRMGYDTKTMRVIWPFRRYPFIEGHIEGEELVNIDATKKNLMWRMKEINSGEIVLIPQHATLKRQWEEELSEEQRKGQLAVLYQGDAMEVNEDTGVEELGYRRTFFYPKVV